MHTAPHLLSMLLTLLAGKGLSPETLDPWRAWQVFKHYARIVDELPEPGVSVQVAYDATADETWLSFVRQAVELEPDDHRLTPLGGVVCDLAFAGKLGAPRQLWSFDCASFDRFVDMVEQDPVFGDLVVRRPVRTGVYWVDVWGHADA